VIVFLNGQFVPAEQAVVSVFDRSFLYGDGLFETVRVCHGKPFRWAEHLRRLERGAEFLRLRVPFDATALTRFARELSQRNQMPDCVLRVTLSRGVGPRGYSPKGADQPTLVMTLHPPPQLGAEKPPRWRLITSSFRVPTHDRLALYKTANKLPHILARAEAEDRGADDALLLNTDSEVAETTSANLFWIRDKTVFTPPLCTGILAGVTRAGLLELCRSLGIECEEKSVRLDGLKKADAVFLTLSSLGIVEVAGLDEVSFKSSAITEVLREAHLQAVEKETRGC